MRYQIAQETVRPGMTFDRLSDAIDEAVNLGNDPDFPTIICLEDREDVIVWPPEFCNVAEKWPPLDGAL